MSINGVSANYAQNTLKVDGCEINNQTDNDISYFLSPKDDSLTLVNSKKRPDGEEFYQGIEENKEKICETLGISSDKYDALSLLALGIAAQETDSGAELSYKIENSFIGAPIRNFFKEIEMEAKGTESASSGLTQVKIYEFLNSGKLEPSEVELLKSLGVSSNSPTENNLYDNPDLAASATIVVLNNLNNKYEKYMETLNQRKEETRANLDENLSDEECYQKGEGILSSFVEVYDSIENDKIKKLLRDDMNAWVMSINNSKKSFGNIFDNDNEQRNLEALNKDLAKQGFDFSFEQSDLDYIRYFLTSDGNEMTRMEYCAYAWNTGTGDTSYQLDRMIAGKLRVILKDPEKFDYSQYIPSVVEMANLYAQEFDEDRGFINENLNN